MSKLVAVKALRTFHLGGRTPPLCSLGEEFEMEASEADVYERNGFVEVLHAEGSSPGSAADTPASSAPDPEESSVEEGDHPDAGAAASGAEDSAPKSRRRRR
jgi:hypothetical protein